MNGTPGAMDHDAPESQLVVVKGGGRGLRNLLTDGRAEIDAPVNALFDEHLRL